MGKNNTFLMAMHSGKYIQQKNIPKYAVSKTNKTLASSRKGKSASQKIHSRRWKNWENIRLPKNMYR
jgi:hypothetical protein